MKRRYQIDQQRAVQEFRQLAREENPNLQMIFPLAEVVGLLQEGVGNLLREAGLTLMQLVMEEEVRHWAGERHEQHPARRAHRWGKEAGYCVVDGQKVPMRRTRLRTPENREQRLGSYELFQRSGPMEHAVWDKMMRGLSTRNYGAVVKDFHDAYGVEKSAVSENFIAASREKLQELMERPAGRVTAVRGTDRRHAVPRPADDRGPGDQHRRAQNGVGPARRSHRECRRGQRVARRSGLARAGLQRAAAVCARRRQGAGGGGAAACGRGGDDPALPGA